VDAHPTVAYAATAAGIFKTENNGDSWKNILTRPADLVAVSSADGNTAYASSTDRFEVVKTTDGGATWTHVVSDIASVLGLAPSDPATLYAALYDKAMSKSTDGGRTWSRIMIGLPQDFFYSYSMGGWEAGPMAIDPASSSTVYIQKSQGLFKTIDGGVSWTQVSGITSRSLVIDERNTRTLYAAENGVMKSSDGGQTWTGAGLAGKVVTALTITKTSSSPILLAGTRDGHVFRTTDGGASWSEPEDGLPRAAVLRLSVDASGEYLYAATSAGVYQYHFINRSGRQRLRR
jgi:photosystem II stability/assembly factor-like uncharacterized protein